MLSHAVEVHCLERHLGECWAWLEGEGYEIWRVLLQHCQIFMTHIAVSHIEGGDTKDRVQAVY